VDENAQLVKHVKLVGDAVRDFVVQCYNSGCVLYNINTISTNEISGFNSSRHDNQIDKQHHHQQHPAPAVCFQ